MAPRSKTVKKAKKAALRRSSGNVFTDLGFDQEEAERLKIKSALMAMVRQVINDGEMTQAEAAEVFQVTQPRISNLMRGKIDLFSIDALIEMLARAGIRIEIRAKIARKKGKVA